MKKVFIIIVLTLCGIVTISSQIRVKSVSYTPSTGEFGEAFIDYGEELSAVSLSMTEVYKYPSKDLKEKQFNYRVLIKTHNGMEPATVKVLKGKNGSGEEEYSWVFKTSNKEYTIPYLKILAAGFTSSDGWNISQMSVNEDTKYLCYHTDANHESCISYSMYGIK